MKFLTTPILLASFIHPENLLAQIPELIFEAKGMKIKREWIAKDAGPIWGMAALPDGDLLTTLKSGQVKIFRVKTKSWDTIQNPPQSVVQGQGGLMEVVLAPDFQKSKAVYFSYAKEVAKGQFTTAFASATLDGNNLKDLKEFFVAKGSSNKGEHFGGRMVVDSKDSIWISVGERGERENSQKLDNHLGKILRIDSEGKAHPDNPFIKDKKGLAEIYSYGHRNPQGLARHPDTKELWSHEHGPRGGDEINIILAGENYGWPKATYGKEYWGPSIGEEKVAGTKEPLSYWTPSIAPSGLVIYSGKMFPGWKSHLIIGALKLAHLNVTSFASGKKVSEDRYFDGDSQRIREVEEGPEGEIWYSTDQGNLFRLTKA